jgi:PIN domain nuclease of toxin-antitoxin system
MRYIVDTCTLIWALQSPRKLSPNARSILENSANEVLVSVISFWEISLKRMLGKLIFSKSVPEQIPSFVQEIGWSVLSLDANTASTFHRLPVFRNHRDPFDRMLIWQAICLKIPLISADSSMSHYRSYGLRLEI